MTLLLLFFSQFQESFLIYVFHFTRFSSLLLLRMVSMLPMVVLSARMAQRAKRAQGKYNRASSKSFGFVLLRVVSIFRVEEFRYDPAGWLPYNIMGDQLLLTFGAKFQRYNFSVTCVITNCYGNVPYVSVPIWRQAFKMSWLKKSGH